MANSIAMPLLSPTMTEGKIAKWSKKEGDAVKSGDALAEVETDKATLDVEVYDPGVLLKILAPAGAVVKVGAPIAIVGKAGEDIAALIAGAAAPAAPAQPAPASAPAAAKPAAAPAPVAAKPAPAPAPTPKPTPAPAPVSKPAPAAAPSAPAGGRTRSSPLARKLAREGGLEIGAITGSGPSGRVIKRDVEEALKQGGTPHAAEAGPEEVIPLSGMRKVIAERLVAAKREVPHFYLTVEIDMERAVAIRADLKEAGVAASINDFILRACALALVKVPAANRSWSEVGLVQHRSSDIGVAVALDDGLITPIVKGAEHKSVSAIAAEVKVLAERGRNRKLKPEEYQGGSMSVSNLGMYGVDEFSAVINPPQACILAVGAVTERPAAVNGKLEVRKRMTVTLSCDHRVIDGALGAKLLAEIKQLLEKPVTLGF